MKCSRRFLAWLLVVMMTFAVLACGCGGSDNDSGGSSSTSDTADDDGSGRNIEGFEDVEFIRLSGQWAFTSSSLTNNGYKIGEVDVLTVDPLERFRIKAYGDGTLLLADYDAGEKPKAFSFLPVTAECTFTEDNEVKTLALVAPAVYTYVSKNVYKMTEDTKDALGTITARDVYRIEIKDSTYKFINFIHIRYNRNYYNNQFDEVYTLTSELVSHQLDYADEDDYTGRNSDGWEVVDDFSLLNGTNATCSWASSSEYDRYFPLVPNSYNATKLKLVAESGILFWVDADGRYRYDPLTARFSTDDAGNSVEKPLVQSAGVFEPGIQSNWYESPTSDGGTETVIIESSYPYTRLTIMNTCYVNGREAITRVTLESAN